MNAAQRWPDFLVIGAPRSGTTFLYSLFDQLPGVFVPRVKEPNFFARSINPRRKLNKPVWDEEKYLALFEPATADQIIGETSPTYLWDPLAPSLIKRRVPDVRIIAMLRDPVERSYSHYLMGLGIGSETEAYIPAMRSALSRPDDYSGRVARAGFYARQVERYLETFPREQLLILIFEEFSADPESHFPSILRHIRFEGSIPEDLVYYTNTFDMPLGAFSKYVIRNRVLRWMVREWLPVGAAPYLRKLFRREARKPPMSSEERRFAEELYREDVLELERILGRELPWFHRRRPAGRVHEGAPVCGAQGERA